MTQYSWHYQYNYKHTQIKCYILRLAEYSWHYYHSQTNWKIL
jgi:hypothetical protein